MLTRFQLLRARLRATPQLLRRPSTLIKSIVGIPLALLTLTTASCDPGCGLFGNANECSQNTFDALTAIRLSLTVSAREFDIADGMMVRVIARNVSKVRVTVPEQTCSRPFYVYGDAGLTAADPPSFCNGSSYPGAALAPGDSIVWSADVRTEMRNYGKDLPSGEYRIRGRVKYGERVLYTEFDTVQITRKVP